MSFTPKTGQPLKVVNVVGKWSSKSARDAAVFVGAAPNSLIDGQKLLDLTIQHKIEILQLSIEQDDEPGE